MPFDQPLKGICEMNDETKSTAKMRYCFICGCEIGIYENRFHNRTDTCGERECERDVRNMYEQEGAEAHEKLDRDLRN